MTAFRSAIYIDVTTPEGLCSVGQTIPESLPELRVRSGWLMDSAAHVAGVVFGDELSARDQLPDAIELNVTENPILAGQIPFPIDIPRGRSGGIWTVNADAKMLRNLKNRFLPLATERRDVLDIVHYFALAGLAGQFVTNLNLSMPLRKVNEHIERLEDREPYLRAISMGGFDKTPNIGDVVAAWDSVDTPHIARVNALRLSFGLAASAKNMQHINSSVSRIAQATIALHVNVENTLPYLAIARAYNVDEATARAVHAMTLSHVELALSAPMAAEEIDTALSMLR